MGSDGTKPLSEPMLTSYAIYFNLGPLVITSGRLDHMLSRPDDFIPHPYSISSRQDDFYLIKTRSNFGPSEKNIVPGYKSRLNEAKVVFTRTK